MLCLRDAWIELRMCWTSLGSSLISSKADTRGLMSLLTYVAAKIWFSSYDCETEFWFVSFSIAFIWASVLGENSDKSACGNNSTLWGGGRGFGASFWTWVWSIWISTDWKFCVLETYLLIAFLWFNWLAFDWKTSVVRGLNMFWSRVPACVELILCLSMARGDSSNDNCWEWS